MPCPCCGTVIYVYTQRDVMAVCTHGATSVVPWDIFELALRAAQVAR